MKSSQFTVSVPASVCLSMNMEADEFAREMRKEYGLKLYQTGKLTLSQSADFCGSNMYEFISMLTLAGIPVVGYSADELENEFQYLSKLMG